MDKFQSDINEVLSKTSGLLQDLVTLESNQGSTSFSDATNSNNSGSDLLFTESNNKVTQKVISLITDLTKLSMRAGYIAKHSGIKEKKTISCLESLRDLVKKQQDEINRLKIVTKAEKDRKISGQDQGVNTDKDVELVSRRKKDSLCGLIF